MLRCGIVGVVGVVVVVVVEGEDKLEGFHRPFEPRFAGPIGTRQWQRKCIFVHDIIKYMVYTKSSTQNLHFLLELQLS